MSCPYILSKWKTVHFLKRKQWSIFTTWTQNAYTFLIDIYLHQSRDYYSLNVHTSEGASISVSSLKDCESSKSSEDATSLACNKYIKIKRVAHSSHIHAFKKSSNIILGQWIIMYRSYGWFLYQAKFISVLNNYNKFLSALLYFNSCSNYKCI